MEESYGVDTEDMVGMPVAGRRGEHYQINTNSFAETEVQALCQLPAEAKLNLSSTMVSRPW